jgi:hypothetical protein
MCGHVARIGEMINTIFWSENLKGRDHSVELDVGGKIILEWILGNYGAKVRTGCVCGSG